LEKIGAYVPRKTPLPSIPFMTNLDIRIKTKDQISKI